MKDKDSSGVSIGKDLVRFCTPLLIGILAGLLVKAKVEENTNHFNEWCRYSSGATGVEHQIDIINQAVTDYGDRAYYAPDGEVRVICKTVVDGDKVTIPAETQIDDKGHIYKPVNIGDGEDAIVIVKDDPYDSTDVFVYDDSLYIKDLNNIHKLIKKAEDK